jgi:menaquinol-cytochrome c reductase iron-sulfur subunit
MPRRLTEDHDLPGAFEGETMTRRRVMTTGAHATGAIALAAVLLPSIGFAVGPIFQRAKAHWQPIGRPDQFPDDTYVPKIITLDPTIGEAGKTTIFVRRRNPRIDAEAGDRWNQFIALTSRCSHVGCPVGFKDAAQVFVCPCHGGVYDLAGKRIGGPPPRPLDRFYTRLRAGQVEVGPRYSVDSELHRYSPRNPGEPLDGIGKYVYPPRPTTPGAPS